MRVADESASPATDNPAGDERPAEPKRRRPYEPPAIEGGGGFAPITLGTRPPIGPGRGC